MNELAKIVGALAVVSVAVVGIPLLMLVLGYPGYAILTFICFLVLVWLARMEAYTP